MRPDETAKNSSLTTLCVRAENSAARVQPYTGSGAALGSSTLQRQSSPMTMVEPALLVGRGVTKVVPGHRFCHSRILRKASGSLRKASGSLDPWHSALSSVTTDRRDFKDRGSKHPSRSGCLKQGFIGPGPNLGYPVLTTSRSRGA